MSVASERLNPSRYLSPAQLQWIILGGFTLTLFLSALLLFSVQPIFAKMVLPTLGGSPSVWAVSMCFFQAALLAGYCYAHALNRLVPPRFAPFVHIALMSSALLALPFGLPADWSEPPAGDAYFWLLGLLTVGVGLPFFAVSANAPLLQAWFSKSGHPHANDPYFLYGASNLGSLIALLSYPLAIEPFLGLGNQATIWTTGFITLTLLVAGCGTMIVMQYSGGRTAAEQAATSKADADTAGVVGWRDRASWIALAFIPSGLLVAFTTYVTTDIASAPFIWVVPLAVFLGTFILVFRDEPLIPNSAMLFAQPVALTVVMYGFLLDGSSAWVIGSIGGFAAFFVTTMVCHKQLYDLRPASRHLTEFYLYMSLGGVLGGVFAAIVAPQLFTSVFEFPLLVIAGMACRPGVFRRFAQPDVKQLKIAIAIVAGACVLAQVLAEMAVVPGADNAVRRLTLLGLCVPLIWHSRNAAMQSAYAVLIAVAMQILPPGNASVYAERSFFGTLRVIESDKGAAHLLMHGTTLHGYQRLRDKDGKAISPPVPSAYYHPKGPMAVGADIVRMTRFAADPTPMRVGVVGLGAGAMACNSKPGEAWSFYEIDPLVVKVAKDPKWFTYLSDCQPHAAMLVGDARLTVGREKAHSFDYLVIDAFSSDSVPIHLLTREALELYLSKLKPGGLLAMHVSNRHMELMGVLKVTAATIPGTKVRLAFDLQKNDGARQSSMVVFLGKDDAVMNEVGKLPFILPANKKLAITPWTDDYSNILAAIWRHYSPN